MNSWMSTLLSACCPAVEDVEHRHGQDVRVHAAQVAVQRQPALLGRSVRRRQRHAQDRVGAQARLVRRPVQLDHRPVDVALVERLLALELHRQFAVDALDGLQHALAAVAPLSVAQLVGLVGAGAGARGHRGPALRAGGEQDLHLDRRIAPGIQDLAAAYGDDLAHGPDPTRPKGVNLAPGIYRRSESRTGLARHSWPGYKRRPARAKPPARRPHEARVDAAEPADARQRGLRAPGALEGDRRADRPSRALRSQARGGLLARVPGDDLRRPRRPRRADDEELQRLRRPARLVRRRADLRGRPRDAGQGAARAPRRPAPAAALRRGGRVRSDGHPAPGPLQPRDGARRRGAPGLQWAALARRRGHGLRLDPDVPQPAGHHRGIGGHADRRREGARLPAPAVPGGRHGGAAARARPAVADPRPPDGQPRALPAPRVDAAVARRQVPHPGDRGHPGARAVQRARAGALPERPRVRRFRGAAHPASGTRGGRARRRRWRARGGARILERAGARPGGHRAGLERRRPGADPRSRPRGAGAHGGRRRAEALALARDDRGGGDRSVKRRT